MVILGLVFVLSQAIIINNCKVTIFWNNIANIAMVLCLGLFRVTNSRDDRRV